MEEMATTAEQSMRAANIEVLKYAIIVFGSIPLIILYPFVQKHFDKGCYDRFSKRIRSICMVAEHKIDRQKLISGHNPVLTEIATDAPLTVGNGELAFTADITRNADAIRGISGTPVVYNVTRGWHTKPVSREKYNYTLDDLVMTEYVNREGRLLKYPQDKKVGNEDVYNWLRENPHRLNLVRVRLQWEEESISAEDITGVRQELVLYEGILYSEFQIRNNACRVRTACHNEGRDILGLFSGERGTEGEKELV